MKMILPTAIALFALSSAAIGFTISHHTHDANSTSGLEVRNDHSGRTNSAGCHNETKTGGYHCH